MAATPGWKVEVTGLRQVFDALDEVDKKAANLIRKEITQAGKDVVSHAQAMVTGEPLRNWGKWTFSRDGRDLGFDPGRVAANIKLRRNNFRRRGVSAGLSYDVYNMSAGGSLFEVIGDESRVGESPYNWQGEGFVRRIKARYPGKSPRILLPAYYKGVPDDLKDRIRDRIIDEARKAGLT